MCKQLNLMNRKCKQCGKDVPNRILIDGKVRHTNKRVYCLECSPFGKHNTKQLHINTDHGDKECICTQCNKKYVYRRNASNSTIRCHSCYVKNRRRQIKIECVKQMGGKCVICGYNKCPASLDFHHINPEEKEFGVSGNNYSKSRIDNEIKKCILVCKNCHGEIESGLIIDVDKFYGHEGKVVEPQPCHG